MVRPLDGIRVVDLSQGAGGPYAAGLLAAHGASVTKVEPVGGEWGRYLGPPFIGDMAAGVAGINAGKRSVAIDAKTEEGREAIGRLLRDADILIESFRPGVMDRLGLGWGELHKRLPALVYCSLTAFGATGPLAERPGVDGAIQAMGGLMSIIGHEGSAPAKVGAPAADMLAGMQLAHGATLALLDRHRTGVGAHVEVSLLDALLEFQQIPLNMFLADPDVPTRTGSGAPYSTPNESYRTQDGHVFVAAYTAQRWPALCEAIGAPDLVDDARFATNGDRLRNRAELTAVLESRFVTRPTQHWIEALEAVDVICAPLLDYRALIGQEHVLRGGMLRQAGNGSRTVGVALRSSAYRTSEASPAPRLGADTAAVLAEAGFSQDEVANMLSRNIIRIDADTQKTERNAQ